MAHLKKTLNPLLLVIELFLMYNLFSKTFKARKVGKPLSWHIGPHPRNPEFEPQAQHQKSALPRLFGLTTAFQNGMT